MSNHTSTIRRLAAGLATTAAVVVPAVATAGAASASDLTGFDQPKQFEPVPIGEIPTLEPVVDVKFDPFIPAPLPCFGWWCDNNPFTLPDYVAGFDSIPSVTSTYDGQVATPYYARISNKGFVKGGPVWSSLSARGGDILAIEPVNPWRSDLRFEQVSDTATTTAPKDAAHLDDAWIVHDTDGIGFSRADTVYVRIWVTGTGDAELVVDANEHVGVDALGSPRPDGYRPAELTRSNNHVEFTV